MKTYVGTKILSAAPMSHAAYNKYRNWELPANENGADEGYLVEYLDGGAPNDSRHTGYISWSPKAQFEAAYLCIGDVSGMPAHQQRVVAEKVQLDDKRDKLHAFKQSDKFHQLCDSDERGRMIDQVIAMDAYSEALGLRIRAFKA